MKRLLCIVLMGLHHQVATAQYLSNTNYELTFGDLATEAPFGKTLIQGDYVYTIGHSLVTNEGSNILVKKHHKDGSLTWENSYSNPGNTMDYGVDLQMDPDGNVYAVAAYDNGANGYDVLVLKYSSSGSSTWTYSYSSTPGVDDIPTSLALDASNNVYLTGITGHGTANADVLSIALNSDGTEAWVETYDYDGTTDGGILTEVSGSNLLVFSITTDDGGQQELSKLSYENSSGNLTSSQRTSIGSSMGLNSLQKAPNGKYVACGWIYNGAGDKDLALYCFNSNLSTNWSYTYDSGGGTDAGMAMAFDASSNTYVAGSIDIETDEKAILIKCNSSGTYQWKYTMKAPQFTSNTKSLCYDNSKVWMAGELWEAETSEQFYTMAFDEAGTEEWYRQWERSEAFELQNLNMENDDFTIIGVSKGNSLKYVHIGGSLYQQDFSPINDANGDPYNIDDQLLVTFKRDVLNLSFIDNTSLTFIPAREAFASGIIDSFENSLDTLVDWDSVTVSKIYPYYTSADTADTNVFGDTVRYSYPWCELLLHFDQQIDEKQIDTLLDTLGYGVIDFSSLNYCMRDLSAPDDTYFQSQQGALYDNGGIDETINWLDAWEGDYLRYLSPERVAVVDGGIDWYHFDFEKSNGKSKIRIGYDGLSLSRVSTGGYKDHATEIAGIIGANTDNDLGIAGVVGGYYNQADYGATLVDLRSGKVNEDFQVWSAVKAASNWGIHFEYVSVLNHSFSVPPASDDYFGFKDYYAGLPSTGVITCTAIDENPNNFWDGASSTYSGDVMHTFFPGCIAGDYCGLNAARYDPDVLPNRNSTYGAYLTYDGQSTIDLLAPGHQKFIYTTQLGGGYAAENGNSYSTGVASGASAALLGYFRFHHKGKLVQEDVEQLLERSAKDIDSLPFSFVLTDATTAVGYDAPTGWGQMQLAEALQLIELPNHTIKHFHSSSSVSVTKILDGATVTFREPIMSYVERKNSSQPNKYEKYKIDLYEVSISIPYTWAEGYQIVDTDAQGRKGFWPHNSQSFYLDYDSDEEQIIPYTNLQWTTEPSGTSGTAVLKGYTMYLIKEKNSLKKIEKYWPINPFDDALLNASFSVYLTKNWANSLAETPTRSQIRVFPNPASGLVQITGLSDNYSNVLLMSMSGREIQPQVLKTSNGISLQLGTLAPGAYILQLTDQNEVHTEKLLLR